MLSPKFCCFSLCSGGSFHVVVVTNQSWLKRFVEHVRDTFVVAIKESSSPVELQRTLSDKMVYDIEDHCGISYQSQNATTRN